MNISQALSAEHTKRQMMAIVDYIGNDPQKFDELMRVFFAGEYRLTQRASYPINYVAEHSPQLIQPYLNKLITELARKDVNVAVKRNAVRLLQFVEIPKKLAGKAYSHCLDLIEDKDEPIAVRVFAITVAGTIAKAEPELLSELKLFLERNLSRSSPAISVRVRRIQAL